jgi:hypothetical protein
MVESYGNSLPQVNEVNLRSTLPKGLTLLLTPIIILVGILISGNFYLLEYFHVLSGSAWTGMDLIMGIFFAYIMRGLRNEERAEVSKRLIPVMLFFMPAIATTTITAGIYLAFAMNINIYSDYFIVVAILALSLMILGLLVFLPNELRIYLELKRGAKNISKIVSLTMLTFSKNHHHITSIIWPNFTYACS